MELENKDAPDVALMLEKEIDKRVAMALVRFIRPWDENPMEIALGYDGNYQAVQHIGEALVEALAQNPRFKQLIKQVIKESL